MPNLGAPEILIILLVALLVFGPRKLPELGKSLGAGLREFRRSTQGLKEEFDGVMRDAPAAPAPAQVQVIAAQPQVEAGQGTPVAAAAVTPQQVTPQAVAAAVAPVQAVPEPVKQEG